MKLVDFNVLQRPTFPIVLCDEARTVVHVGAPTVELVSELRANHDGIQEALDDAKDARKSEAVYHLCARLINCNLNGIEMDGRELATHYRMSLEALKYFLDNYLEFLTELSNEKN